MRGDGDDLQVAEGLLSGTLPTDDAPPGLARVADLLGSARSDLTRPMPADDALTAAMVAAIGTAVPQTLTSRRKPMLAKILTAKAAAAIAVLTIGVTGAAAATGNLPDAAQDGIANAVDHVGIHLPTSDSGKGADIAPIATSSDTTGVDHGAAVSSAASGGKSQAGQDHPSSDDHPTASDNPGSDQSSNSSSADDHSTEGDSTSSDQSSNSSSADDHPTESSHPTESDHLSGRP